jgi:hypothetical protein
MLRSLLLSLVLPFLSGALSSGIRRILKDGPLREVVLSVIQTAAQAANMNAADRKAYAFGRLREFLDRQGIALSDSELNLLIEIVYGWLRRTKPGAIAPQPFSMGHRG